MKKLLFVLLVILMCLESSKHSLAVTIPSLLLTSPDDLESLVVGDIVTLQITLEDLSEQNQDVFALGADIILPDTHFDLLNGPTPGAVVPTADGFSGSDFLIDGQLILTAFYDNESETLPAIEQNGVFYELLFKAKAEGSGEIKFDLAAPPQILGSDDTEPTPFITLFAGPPIPYRIRAVPEPSAAVLASLLGLIALGASRMVRLNR